LLEDYEDRRSRGGFASKKMHFSQTFGRLSLRPSKSPGMVFGDKYVDATSERYKVPDKSEYWLTGTRMKWDAAVFLERIPNPCHRTFQFCPFHYYKCGFPFIKNLAK
jgi:hypothetical protein